MATELIEDFFFFSDENSYDVYMESSLPNLSEIG